MSARCRVSPAMTLCGLEVTLTFTSGGESVSALFRSEDGLKGEGALGMDADEGTFADVA